MLAFHSELQSSRSCHLFGIAVLKFHVILQVNEHNSYQGKTDLNLMALCSVQYLLVLLILDICLKLFVICLFFSVVYVILKVVGPDVSCLLAVILNNA